MNEVDDTLVAFEVHGIHFLAHFWIWLKISLIWSKEVKKNV